MATFDLLAAVTTDGAAKLCQAILDGYAIQIVQFVSASDGHDPGSPSQPLTPDVSQTCATVDCTTGVRDITSSALAAGNCIQIVCTLPAGVSTGDISSIKLLAQVVTEEHELYGLNFLFAIANHARQGKLAGEERIYTLTVVLS
jgi:hypothetical protein